MGQFVGRAQGATKKRAEQEAARQVLEHIATLPGRIRMVEKAAAHRP
jgi:dsRNA-specific ribonuclease